MMKSDSIRISQSVLADVAKTNRVGIARKAATLKVDPIANLTERNKYYNVEAIRHLLRYFVHKKEGAIEKNVHVFYNFKGGTGKTSLCYQVASLVALMGYRVLAIDMDPQAHLSSMLWFDEAASHHTIYDALVGGVPFTDCVHTVFEGLDAIPSNLSLTKLEISLSTKNKREGLLKKFLEPIKHKYDFIFIDTNPTISISNINALVASDQVNIVTETQPFSLAGLSLLVEENEKLGHEMEMAFNFKIIANKYEAKTVTSQEVLGALRTDYKESAFKTVVRKNEDINIASKKHLPVCVFANKKSPGFEDILDLTYELLEMSRKANVSKKESPMEKVA